MNVKIFSIFRNESALHKLHFQKVNDRLNPPSQDFRKQRLHSLRKCNFPLKKTQSLSPFENLHLFLVKDSMKM